MPIDLSYLDGKRVSVVFVDPESTEENAKLRVLHGRGNILHNGKLSVEHEAGNFIVPPTCYNHVLKNDGTPILGNCDYYVFCKVGEINTPSS
jgi:hypothetical protein